MAHDQGVTDAINGQANAARRLEERVAELERLVALLQKRALSGR